MSVTLRSETHPDDERADYTKIKSFCPNCQHELKCQECGGAMKLVCPECAYNIPKVPERRPLADWFTGNW